MLDVGSGSGYLTTLAAQLVGASGSAVGVEVRLSALQPGSSSHRLITCDDCSSQMLPHS